MPSVYVIRIAPHSARRIVRDKRPPGDHRAGSAPSERIASRTSAVKARISVWVGPTAKTCGSPRSVTSFLPQPLNSK